METVATVFEETAMSRSAAMEQVARATRRGRSTRWYLV